MLDGKNNESPAQMILNNIAKINKGNNNKGKNLIKENNKSYTNNHTSNN